MNFEEEKVFKGAREIKYLYKKADSPYLVIVFSGFPKPYSPALYNYVRTLEALDVNKLFILDEYGAAEPEGCYYLGENMDLSVESSVIALITYIVRQNHLDFSNIIACGSSKGGFAALYYGFKYGFGTAIAGGAQILLGNYLLKEVSVTRPVAQYIAGGTEKRHLDYLNGLLREVIAGSNNIPALFLHVGQGEPHFEKHFKPLLEMLHDRKIEYSLDLGKYDTHSRLIEFYPKFLLKTLHEVLYAGVPN